MTNTPKDKSTKGVRYTDAQKKEVVDFATSFNAANGRGGQSKAAEKFKISQITVATWLKAAGAPAPVAGKTAKAAKAAKAPKVAKKAKASKAVKAPKAAKAVKATKTTKAAKSNSGSRYTPEKKQEVVDFTVAYNAENGRGGQSKASAKFGVSPLTVMAWLKAAGAKTGVNKVGKKTTKKAKLPKAPKVPKAAVSGSFDSKLVALLALSKEITKAEAELAKLVAKFNSAKASL